jgi:hypothetical protein
MQEPAHQAPVNPDRSVKLPEFCGEVDIDKMSVMEYISAVEMSRIAGNWSDAITAERVKLRLSGPARTWLNNRIRAETAGLNVFDPAAVAGAKPPGLRQLLIDRFMPQHTAAEQERLRATLIQQENEAVNTFFDRVESIQFLLDQDLPDDFRRNHKASYDIVHNRQVQTSFIAGLKSDIRKHVAMANVVTLTDALNAAVAFEKASKRPDKGPMVISGATGGEGMTIEARIAALELQKRQNDGAGAGAGRGQGKLADEGCFYCGYVGHTKQVCRIRQGDEARGVFQKRATGYVSGRTGRGRGGGQQRGGGPNRGGGGFQPNRGRGNGNFRGAGAYRGRGGYAHSAMEQTGTYPGSYQPNQQQGPIVPQPGFQPYTGWPQSHSSTPTSSTEMAGYFQDFSSMGAARFGGGPEN